MKKCLVVLAWVAWTPILHAEIIDSSAIGFTIRHEVKVNASVAEVYRAMTKGIANWWDARHSYTGQAKNFYLSAKPGGCLCERMKGGGVEHMRVVYASPTGILRLQGGLGPLQSMAVTGSMTWALKAEGTQTLIQWTYTVGGYHPKGLTWIAAPVDGVLGGQLERLKGYVEGE